ncbi:MAG: DUF3422 domain-containing protein [Proteobacteria bacterium]|nr:DUF3422 domain-containing protein [Pseudomonadota bacterium]
MATANEPVGTVREHPQRVALANEVHARPFLSLTAPERASHLAMTSGEQGAAADRAHLTALCERYGIAHPPPGANHFVAELDGFRVKWERHIEFCTWTFLRAGAFGTPFAQNAIDLAPPEWVAAIPGERIVAVHVALLSRERAAPELDELAGWLHADYLVGSDLAGGRAIAWTDFRLHADGFGRLVVHDRGLGSRQCGRVIQRLLEIETYRTMAMLALPVARDIGPRISAVDGALLGIMDAMPGSTGIAEQRALLDRLTALSAQIERATAESAYRFGAARAYSDLVAKRVAELREARIEGLQTYKEFMDRRFAPALRTCEATAERLARMSERLTRAGALLRTRVDIAVEAQNQDLLASMDRRAQIQLRLQETVEGLSVAAITYYTVGLVGYALHALDAAGLHVDKDIGTGIAIPVVAVLVWLGLRRFRRSLARGAAAGPKDAGRPG